MNATAIHDVPRLALPPAAMAAVQESALALVLNVEPLHGPLMAPMLSILRGFASLSKVASAVALEANLPIPIPREYISFVGVFLDELVDLALSTAGDASAYVTCIGLAPPPSRGLVASTTSVWRDGSFSARLAGSLTGAAGAGDLLRSLPSAADVPYLLVAGDASSPDLVRDALEHFWQPLLNGIGNATAIERLYREFVGLALQALNETDGAALAVVDNGFRYRSRDGVEGVAFTPGLVTIFPSASAADKLRARHDALTSVFSLGFDAVVEAASYPSLEPFLGTLAPPAAMLPRRIEEAVLAAGGDATVAAIAAAAAAAAAKARGVRCLGSNEEICLSLPPPVERVIAGVAFERRTVSLVFKSAVAAAFAHGDRPTVGDRVRLAPGKFSAACLSGSDVATIARDDHDSIPYTLSCGGGYVRESDIVLDRPHVAPTAEASAADGATRVELDWNVGIDEVSGRTLLFGALDDAVIEKFVAAARAGSAKAGSAKGGVKPTAAAAAAAAAAAVPLYADDDSVRRKIAPPKAGVLLIHPVRFYRAACALKSGPAGRLPIFSGIFCREEVGQQSDSHARLEFIDAMTGFSDAPIAFSVVANGTSVTSSFFIEAPVNGFVGAPLQQWLPERVLRHGIEKAIEEDGPDALREFAAPLARVYSAARRNARPAAAAGTTTADHGAALAGLLAALTSGTEEDAAARLRGVPFNAAAAEGIVFDIDDASPSPLVLACRRGFGSVAAALLARPGGNLLVNMLDDNNMTALDLCLANMAPAAAVAAIRDAGGLSGREARFIGEGMRVRAAPGSFPDAASLFALPLRHGSKCLSSVAEEGVVKDTYGDVVVVSCNSGETASVAAEQLLRVGAEPGRFAVGMSVHAKAAQAGGCLGRGRTGRITAVRSYMSSPFAVACDAGAGSSDYTADEIEAVF